MLILNSNVNTKRLNNKETFFFKLVCHKNKYYYYINKYYEHCSGIN